MTHAELVERAKKWLLSGYKVHKHGRVKCGFVLTEPSSLAVEIPDVIGWTSTRSVLVECKASRGDFLSDKKKSFRKIPLMGMGSFRFYFCPPKLINVVDLPEKWGLAWCYPTVVRIKHIPREFDYLKTLARERDMIYSVMRRLHCNIDLNKMSKFMGVKDETTQL